MLHSSDQSRVRAVGRLALGLVVFFLIFFVQVKVSSKGIDLHHDLIVLDSVLRVVSGQTPYVDFFYQYNLGTLAVHYFMFTVLGQSLVALKLGTALCVSLIGVLIYFVLIQRTSLVAAASLSLCWSGLNYFLLQQVVEGYHAWSTIYMTLAVLVSALALVNAHTKSSAYWSALAGLSAAVAFWIKQVAILQVIFTIALLLTYFIFSDERKKILLIIVFYFIGIVLGCLPFLGFLIGSDSLNEWFQAAFVYAALFGKTQDSVLSITKILFNFFPSHTWFVWTIIPLWVTGFSFFLFAAMRNRNPEATEPYFPLVTFSVFSIAGWIQYFPLSHPFHTQFFMVPAFILLGWIVFGQIYREARHLPVFRYARTAAIVVLGPLLIGQNLVHARGLLNKSMEQRTSLSATKAVAGLDFSPVARDRIARFVSDVREYDAAQLDGERVVNLSVDPINVIAAESVNDVGTSRMPFDWTWPNEFFVPGNRAAVLRRLEVSTSVIFSDGVVTIPHFCPTSILQYRSPLTSVHTMLVRAARFEHGTSGIRQKFKPAQDDWGIDSPSRKFALRLSLSASDIELLKSITVTAMRYRDIPSRLRREEVDWYLRLLPQGPAVADLYETRGATGEWYELKDPPGEDEFKLFASIMLRYAALFKNIDSSRAQDLPVYLSTLAGSEIHIARRSVDQIQASSGGQQRAQVGLATLVPVWAASRDVVYRLQDFREGSENYLVLSDDQHGLGTDGDPIAINVQMVFEDNTCRHHEFYRWN